MPKNKKTREVLGPLRAKRNQLKDAIRIPITGARKFEEALDALDVLASGADKKISRDASRVEANLFLDGRADMVTIKPRPKKPRPKPPKAQGGGAPKRDEKVVERRLKLGARKIRDCKK